MRIQELQIRREEKIKQAYAKLKKQNKYTPAYIFTELRKQFDLSERTIEAIIYGEYDARRNKLSNLEPKNHLNLF